MTDVLMTLGTVRFSVQEGAFQSLRRKLDMRVARKERADSSTVRQVLGQDETITIKGTVFPGQAGGAVGRVQSFRDLALTKQPQLLTDGLGNVWGRYIVERVDEDASLHTSYGVPLRQGFEIELGAAGV